MPVSFLKEVDKYPRLRNNAPATSSVEMCSEIWLTSYNLLNGTHTAEHRGLIEDILRRDWGYQGIVMTDWVMTMMESKRSKYRNSLSEKVAAAGGDLFMPGGKKDYERVVKALQDGRLERKQLEISGTRVVRKTQELIG